MPHCSHAVATPGEYSLATEHPELLEEWDWDANQADGFDPDDLLSKYKESSKPFEDNYFTVENSSEQVGII